MKNFKTFIISAGMFATAYSHAGTTISGAMNYIAGDLEDFNSNQGLTVDEGLTYQPRFRIKSKIKANNVIYGIKEEFGLNNGGIAIRYNEFYLLGDFGKLSLGQGSEAGDGAAEKNLGGGHSGGYLLNGGSLWSWDLDNVIREVDGGRTERVRYDTPKLGGVAVLSASVGEPSNTADGNTVNLAISMSGKGWAAGAFTQQNDKSVGSDNNEIGGSLSVRFNEISVSLQGGKVKDEHDTSRIILGYNKGKFGVDFDHVEVNYASTSVRSVGTSFGSSGSFPGVATVTSLADAEFDSTGLTFTYRPVKGVTLYAGVRNIEERALNTIDINSNGFLVGGFIKF